MVRPDRGRYDGNWENGKKHGFGLESTKGINYKGYFEDDKMNGKGEYTIEGKYIFKYDLKK